MNIIIVGCGKVGTCILSSLLEEGHEIVAVDSSPNVIGEIANTFDCMCVCGSGTDCDVLEEAGVNRAELLVAATGSDELNMLTCYLAKGMGVSNTVARIRNPEYNHRNLEFLRQQLDISLVINPDRLAALELYQILELPAATKVESFANRGFLMMELPLREESQLCGEPLMELRKRFKRNFLLCAVRRGEAAMIPDGSFVPQPGDRIVLAAEPSELQKLLRTLGLMKRQIKNVMLLGASRTAYYLAQRLLKDGVSVKIIEKDHARCQTFSELLPKATVIHGDGAQQEMLLEEGIGSMDAFVSLTGMDEENILMSYFAGRVGVGKTIAKVNRSQLDSIAASIGLDCVISSRIISSSLLKRYARALHNSRGSQMETLYRLLDGKVEALEFVVRPDFAKLDVPLKEMRLKKGILIAAIIRGGKTIIPTGDDCISGDDHVVVVATGHALKDLSNILA